MTRPMPAQMASLQRSQAELADLRWVAVHLLKEHARLAKPHACLCSICRAATRGVPAPPLGVTPTALQHAGP